MRRHFAYARYVFRHKFFVFLECLKLGVPIWIALLHDWDKFLPDEWLPYARTFYKPDGSRQYVESVEFAHAWMLHQHRNKHHWQYWLWVEILTHNCANPLREMDYLVWDRGNAQRVVKRYSLSKEWLEIQEPFPGDTVCCPDPMPDVYRREMLADWRGAGRALGFPDTTGWYEKNRDKMMLHPKTRAWIESQLSGQTAARKGKLVQIMHKLHIILLIVFVLLLAVAPTFAQDAPQSTPVVTPVATSAPTAAPPVIVEVPPAETPLYSPVDIILLAVIVLLTVLVGLREVQLREYIRLAFASVPPEGRQFAYDLGSRLAQEVSTLVAATPNTIDDSAWENELKPKIMAMMQEFLRGSQTPGEAVNTTLIPPSASPQG